MIPNTDRMNMLSCNSYSLSISCTIYSH